MASELRPVMPNDLFMAAIEGNSDVLIPRLGLQPDEEPTEIQVTIEASNSSPKQIQTEHQTIQSELQSATGFGDTVLHLLVTRHNRLALKVFQRDRSLLNARNKLSETPLHYAAKVGNERLISELTEIDHVIVKDAIKEIDENGDTPLHVAAKYGHIFVGCELMRCDPTIAHRINNEKLFPLHIAIMKNYTKMVIKMLDVNPILACIPFSDGMFPVHVSARVGCLELVVHFIYHYPNCVEMLDPHRRNLFHIAAENNQIFIFWYVFEDTAMGPTAARMNNACDNDGNTPLHIAAMKGHKLIMEAIWENKMGIDAEIIRNNEGLTPFQLCRRQLGTNERIDPHDDIDRYVSVKGSKFTKEWFDDVMIPAPINKWEETQVLGLGSVLITTVTFAAAFTIPGGYDQDNGIPVLGKRYMFRAFIVANTLAFIQGFVSLLVLLLEARVKFRSRLLLARLSFLLAASSMVVAFGLGMYVTLAPICYPIAIIILVITLFIGSPVGIVCSTVFGPTILQSITSSLTSDICSGWFSLFVLTIPFQLIFCLALL